MSRSAFAFVALCGPLLAAAASAGEIGWIEKFALATDRTAALSQLIPGTEEYYFFHCLHYQQTAQWEKADAALADWVARFGHTPRVIEIENRQALLLYDRDPKRALDLIRNRLSLRFDHQREELNPAATLPTTLDPQLLDRGRLAELAFRQYANNTVEGFEDAAFDLLLARDLTPEQRRNLLGRLRRPDHPNLVKLVAADLGYQNSGGFGQFPIHRQLLLTQLDELLKLRPELRNQRNFVDAYVAKLRPNDDLDWRHDPAALEAYLDRLWAFVSTLDPVHNSLKANVLYQRLTLDRSRGVYDLDRFLAYLALPREVVYTAKTFPLLRAQRQREGKPFGAVDLGVDFSGMTLLPPIGYDEPLVRDFLAHFLVDAENWDKFKPFVDDEYLKRLFAETKIAAGLGDVERWASLLPPEEYRRFKDRIDLDFAATSKTEYAGEAAVGLDLFVKNVGTLIVKVFEVNAADYYRAHAAAVGPDIDLDGLVANSERTFTYAEPPTRRVRRHFEFPQLKSRGVYVVDFIGNGMSSRAVIRKGRLVPLVRTGAAGQVVTVLDEAHQPVPAATLWTGGSLYTPDKAGNILLPFSNAPGRQPVVLADGEFACLDHIDRRPESYALAAGIHVDREELLARRTARVLIRPSLSIDGTPVSVKSLTDVRLSITSTDLDGIPASTEIKDFVLSDVAESVHEFQTPARLASITFALKAKVEVQSRNETIDLATSQTFSVNAIDKTERIEDLHLIRAAGAYAVDLYGKTGEAQPGRAVRLSLKLREFKQPVETTLATDARGRVSLGALPGVESLTATGPDGVARTWQLRGDQHTIRYTVHGAAGSVVEIPYEGAATKPDPAQLSLLELRGETFVADRLGAVKIENGLLKIAGLPPGDYSLLLEDREIPIRLRIAAGEVVKGYVVGDYRQLELRDPQPLQLAPIGTDGDTVRIRLVNASKAARVHLFVTRIAPAFPAYNDLMSVARREPNARFAPAVESLYVAGRDIGDEYRYVLDRRFSTKYPGNMLDRPGLLLNPWAVRDTATGEQQAKAGGEFAPAAPPGESRSEGGAAATVENKGPADPSDLDFLARTSIVLANLVPDETGVIEIDRKTLGPHQDLLAVAVDLENTATRRVSLPEVRGDRLDLRLAVGLDPAQHFMQQQRITALDAGGKLSFDVSAARFEVYDSLGRVLDLYATLDPDATLAEFRFLARWNELKPEEKREQYSKYACHELHLFLHEKDPAFFKAVVRPYLENKPAKTFLDDWLLDRDLSAYLTPWRYGRLNALEKVLLGRRIDAERAATARFVRERVELLPPQADRFERLFRTALAGRALDADGELELSESGVVDETSDAAPASRPAPGSDVPGFGATDGAGGFGGGMGGGGMRGSGPNGRFGYSTNGAFGEAEGLRQLQERKGEAAEKAKDAPERDQSQIFQFHVGRQRQAGDKAALGLESRGEFFDADRKKLAEVRQLYLKLDKTKEWAENDYWHVPNDAANADLIAVSAFWNDLAQLGPGQPFRSTHLAEAARNPHEALVALALLDLPFAAGKHEKKLDGEKLTFTAASPAVVYHEEILPAGEIAEGTPVLVSQNFFRHDDRYRQVAGETTDKFVSDEFLTDVVYGCQVVVTNPTSTPRKLDVLLQIPAGSLPVLNSHVTRSRHLDLPPYQTQSLEYHFYFPAPGDFAHYPVQVSGKDRVLAAVEPFKFHVVAEPTNVDKRSWAYVSQYGSDDDVLAFLKEENVQRLDLGKIAFRLKDAGFFKKLVGLLAARHVYHQTLWSYAVLHDDAPAIREFLQHADGFVAQTGTALRSPLLVIDPVLRKTYELLEYKPLVNARAAQLGREREILNDRFYEQYLRLLDVLSYRRQLDDAELMEVTYYLLLQDRIEEALGTFGRVNAESLQTRLQYDYFAAYLDFYNAEPAQARAIAAKYADHPVERWREAFRNVVNQADEIGKADVKIADDESREQRQAALAASEPSFEFLIEARMVKINYQNLNQVRVNYYPMDVELSFSRNPFVKEQGPRFTHIRPNATATVDLPAGKTTFEFPLPDEFRRSNVLVEIVGAGRTESQAYYANSLKVRTIESYGQVLVTDDAGKPLPKVYIKAYARMQDGGVRFYKDGYTDLRGRFDYATLSTNELEQVARFSLLILSDDRGALVKEAAPPRR